MIPTIDGLFLTQQCYMCNLLTKTNMDGAKTVATPLLTTTKLSLARGSAQIDATEFRRVISALQYLSFITLDISFIVNKFAQLIHQPSSIHWKATKRLLRYLKNTVNHGLHLCFSSSIALKAYSNVDWTRNLDDRKSTTAYLIFIGSNLIFWCIRK